MHTYPRPGWLGACLNEIIHTFTKFVKRLLFARHCIRQWTMGVSNIDEIPVLILEMIDILRINSKKYQVVVNTV